MSRAEEAERIARGELGSPYVYAALGETCTPGHRRDRISSAHPTIVSACPVLSGKQSGCEGCKWQGKRMYDCRGFTWWVLRQVGVKISSVGATTQYNTAKDWAERGTIDRLPEKLCCVFKYRDGKMQHTGLYLGGGKVIHCSEGVQISKLTKDWTHYAVPKGLYGEEAESVTLKKGSTGEAVRKLQQELNAADYDCGEADGIYGAKTAAAVRCLQADAGITVDGIAGPETLAALARLEPAETETEAGGVLYQRVCDIRALIAEGRQKLDEADRLLSQLMG